jgi:mono/diheme cytochrome c family protein
MGMKTLRISAAIALAAGLVAFSYSRLPVRAASTAQAPAAAAATPGAALGTASYAKRCAICHGDQREGILPAFPPLLGIHRQLSDEKIIELVHAGKGRMPGFPKIPNDEMTALLQYLATAPTVAVAPATPPAGGRRGGPQLAGEAAAGEALFGQNCAFCHGRDAMGGETGPDLTSSKLVLGDKHGEAITPVIREGRLEKKMPAFNFSSPELTSLVAFIHARVTIAASMKGGRRGVDVSDLQTGNLQAGKDYFNGAGGCSKCHSPTGDLAGIATRYQGLRLEEQMLYPRDARSTLHVTLPSGEKLVGPLAYQDEFIVGLTDSTGTYRSWPVTAVKFNVDSPVEAHVEQFPKYSDADVHNLMKYLQTLR